MADDVQITVGVALDQLNSSIAKAQQSFASFKSAITEVVAAGGLALFIDKMGELAEQIERSSAILGISTASFQELGLMARLTGGSAEQMTTSLERMQLSAQRGELATSAQGKALRAMNIDVQQFVSSAPDEQMNKLADAVKRLTDQGLNPLNAVLLIAGRGAAGLMPQLQRGREGMDEWRQSMINTGTVIEDKIVKSLAELEQKMTMAKAAITNMGAALLDLIATPFGELVEAIGKSAGAIAKLASAGLLGEYAVRALQYSIQVLLKGMTEEAASDKLNAIMKQADDLYQAAVKLQTITVKPLNLGLGDQSGKLIGAEAENWVKRIQAAYKTEETLINSAATLFGMSEKQKTDILLTELQKREDMEVAALAKARDANKSNPLEYKKYEDQITLIKAKATEDRTKLVTRELEAEQKIWTQAADTIAGAFNSQLHGLLSGTTTWAQAMKNIAVSLIESMISEIVKLGVEWAVNMVFMATAGKGMAAAAAASFVSRLNADAALVFGGVFANMAPELGPAAAGPAAAAQAAVEAQLVNVPKFAVGTDYVPQDMLAMLHQGERVVPAAQNTTNFGNQSLSLNVSAMDGRSVANMFFNNRAFMQQMLNLLARNNPSNVSRLVGSV